MKAFFIVKESVKEPFAEWLSVKELHCHTAPDFEVHKRCFFKDALYSTMSREEAFGMVALLSLELALPIR